MTELETEGRIDIPSLQPGVEVTIRYWGANLSLVSGLQAFHDGGPVTVEQKDLRDPYFLLPFSSYQNPIRRLGFVLVVAVLLLAVWSYWLNKRKQKA